jgi:hypothetical protein
MRYSNEYIYFFDINNDKWCWNGHRVYMLEAEVEFIQNGWDVGQNGYGAFSEAEALRQLVDGGYID